MNQYRTRLLAHRVTQHLPHRTKCTTATQDAVRTAKMMLASQLKDQTDSDSSMVSEECTKVFVNTELDLAQIQCYGFDYDYTLVQYEEDRLNQFIYKAALEHLVEDKRYPNEMKSHLQYDPHFATRGLHFDTRHGTLIKLDCNYDIQSTAVCLGRELLSRDASYTLYQSQHIARNEQQYLRTIADAFAIPEACLLADTVQFFRERQIPFKCEYLADDVAQSISAVHISGQMYRQISEDPAHYIRPVGEQVAQLLQRLQAHQKQVFIITNSPYWFMEAGMKHLLGPDWQTYFDLVIASAGKPNFFTADRDFRKVSKANGRLKWGGIGDKFESGQVYAQGGMNGLIDRVGWRPEEVLYCGDHLHSDLVEPVRESGWRTLCVASEIEHEIRIRGTAEQQALRHELREVEAIIRGVSGEHTETQEALELLQRHRFTLQQELKCAHNEHFGSIFRTHNRPTLYMEQMTRYANIYSSQVTNLLKYPIDAKLYPPRVRLPHEKSKVLRYHGEFLREF